MPFMPLSLWQPCIHLNRVLHNPPPNASSHSICETQAAWTKAEKERRVSGGEGEIEMRKRESESQQEREDR